MELHRKAFSFSHLDKRQFDFNILSQGLSKHKLASKKVDKFYEDRKAKQLQILKDFDEWIAPQLPPEGASYSDPQYWFLWDGASDDEEKHFTDRLNEFLEYTKQGYYLMVPTNDDKEKLHLMIEHIFSSDYILQKCNIKNLDFINVSNMTDFSGLFKYTKFNMPLNKWDVSNVTDMSECFNGCDLFDQDLDQWNMRNVEKADFMLYNCKKFSGNVNGWDLQNLTNADFMFASSPNFNSDLDGWKFGLDDDYYSRGYKLTSVSGMFKECEKFNGKLFDLNLLSSFPNMFKMFNGCKAFNQDLSSVAANEKVSMEFRWLHTQDMFNGCDSFNFRIDNFLGNGLEYYNGDSNRLNPYYHSSNLTGTKIKSVREGVLYVAGKEMSENPNVKALIARLERKQKAI